MTRRSRYVVFAAFLVLIAAGLTAIGWLAGTTAGSIWLMDTVSRQTGYALTARKVEGTLWSGLHLEEVQLRGIDLQAKAGMAHLSWQPLLLLTGKIAIKEFVLKDVHISDNRPPSKAQPDLGWPQVTGVPAWLNMRIGKLQVDGLEYRRMNLSPTVVTGISSRVIWQGSLLSFWNLSVATPSMHVEGAMMAGFRRPSLFLNLAYVPVHPIAGLDKLILNAKLYHAHRPEQVAGKVQLTGMSVKRELLIMTGELGISRNAVTMKNLTLLQPGRRGTLSGAGALVFASGGTKLQARLNLADLDLSRAFPATTAISGVVSIAGNPEDYRGSFAVSNKGAGWRSGRISGSLQGDSKGVRLTALESSLLDGTVTGNSRLDWQQGFSIRGVLSARKLNPAKISPKWKGIINLDLKGAAHWVDKVPLQADLTARLLESRLHGKVLKGDLDARLQHDNLRINSLELHGKGFDIHAGGELRKRLAFNTSISDLSGLLPDAMGRLRGEGWVRWDNKRLSGSCTGTARNIGINGLQIMSAELAADLSASPGYPLHIKSALKGVVYHQFRADAANLNIAGSVANHAIDAELRATGYESKLALSGSYKAGTWQGVITRLSGKDPVGTWSMRAATALRAGADAITLARLIIDGTPGESLTAEGQVTLHPLRGFMRTEWHALNLARLLPLPGKVQLSGLSSGALQARLLGSGRMFLTGRAEASGTILADGHRVTVRQASVQMDWNESKMLSVLELKLADGGLLRGRFSSPKPFSMVIPSSGAIDVDWQGFDIALLHPWLPRGVDMEGRLSGKLKGPLLAGPRFDLKGNAAVSQGVVSWREGASQVAATMRKADVTWGWQGGMQTTGPQSGTFRTSRLTLNGNIDASGVTTLDGHRILMQQAALKLDWGDRGMRNELNLSLADGGRLRGSFSSPLPTALSFPQQGLLAVDWQGFDIALLHPWMPGGLDLEGRLTGQVKGSVLPGNRLDIKGDTALLQGAVHWNAKSGQFNAKLDTADISWTWQGGELVGAVSLALAEYGQARGSFQLPLPAQLPAAVNPKGPVMLSVSGRAREMGLLTSLFPGLIRESNGNLDFTLQAGGIWQNPQYSGYLNLAEASAYLPAAGISIKDVRMAARFEQDKLRIESMQVNSGPGRLEGNGVVQLKDWHVAGYQGSLKGERFQTVYLPELQVLTSPNLTFSGSPEKLSVRGDILVPELIVNDRSGRAPVQPSRDVVVEGAVKPAEKEMGLPLDIQVNVKLGDKVQVKAQGIDAQLKGNLNLSIKKIDEIRSTGVIRVVKGKYKTYGINLDITRGRIFYDGAPIDQPTLDIQALRKVEDVRAGVTIAGTPRTMTIKLYSEPNMPESAILSYIVLGQPLAYTQEQSGLITRAGGNLLTTSTGYRPIQTTAPPGVAQAKNIGSTLSQSMVSVGRYLTPSLYISYGRSLISSGSVLRMRYSVSKHWEVESQTGTESGGDLFYKVDFR